MSNVKSIMVTALIIMGVAFSQNSLTLTNLDTEAGTVDVYMVNEDPVGGYQFGLAGLEMTGGAGGSSEDAEFNIRIPHYLHYQLFAFLSVWGIPDFHSLLSNLITPKVDFSPETFS